MPEPFLSINPSDPGNLAISNQANLLVTAEDTTDSDISGAYWNGSVWTELENVDELGWDKPAVAPIYYH